ncbi:hypothetical protein GP475_10985 [Corynebacterium poyangense]|uniref:Uncharacterized protein n=1 Tax=Corynebacterium poyangense TaxID=2684405 RepID=A0A7H0SRB9_9CORY|nr:hypothetical protein [Corynebacterium poyangense]MBZ8176528.1 hypothetical protein [Corynebacterium poyangense]QNQ91094.1 hypothetical protein GP475_10985 [Corynebacterium poyangense]
MDSEDHWLDSLPADQGHEQRHRVLDTFARPLVRVRRILLYITTTPGKMLTLTVILALAIGAAGFSMSSSSADRQDKLDTLLSTTEPQSDAAHNLYTSLSLADSLATTGFIQGGAENADIRARYEQAIDNAAIAMGDNAMEIRRQLPIYTGLVETARTHNRLGNPVGVAYLADASSLMRERILPAARQLFTTTSLRVTEQQRELPRPQWVPLSGLVAAVLLLIVAQWWLWRLTRRRFNKGFLAATAFMLVALLWVSISNYATWSAGARSFEQATQPWESLTAARISTHQARTDETLALVRRQPAGDFDQAVASVQHALEEVERVRGAEAVEPARKALLSWQDSHNRLNTAISEGNFDKAVSLATTDQYDALDSALAQLISDTRNSMRTLLYEGLAATRLVSVAVAVLSLCAVISIVLGIRPRLQEYL